MRCYQKLSLRLAVLLWLAAISAFSWASVRYMTTEGDQSQTPATWPKNCAIDLDAHNPTLLLFIHPQCPCSTATVTELNKTLARSANPPKLIALILDPSQHDEAWTKNGLWTEVQKIPTAQVIADLEGEFAKEFGVLTSGHVLLYSNTGKLLFSGGITGARGHEGPNLANNKLFETINSYSEDTQSSPYTSAVFGCPIFDEVTTSQIKSCCSSSKEN